MNIEKYLSAGYSGLWVETHEEGRAEASLHTACSAVSGQPFGLYVWSVTTGIFNPSTGETVSETEMPDAALRHFAKLPERSVLLLRDFHAFTGSDASPMLVRMLKDALILGRASHRVIAVVGCKVALPGEVEKLMTVLPMSLPTRAELLPVLQGIATAGRVALNGNTDALLDAASGLTTGEAEDAFALGLIDGRAVGHIDAGTVARVKAGTLKKGILEVIESGVSLADVGGYGALKSWLTRRKAAFGKTARAYGLPEPKGMLAVGIPGCGKSLLAKATAGALALPLLRLDAGKLFGSHVGQSESQCRTALATAEAVAPAVLWIDEIEKGFSGSKSSGSTDGGTSARVLGTFLSWMQEKTAPVFVVATANDIAQLPPEFLRKGRWDELFFVDLPDAEERAEIWAIHIRRAGRKVDAYDVSSLVDVSAGWTGAEIEACFREALFTGFDAGREPTDGDILEAARLLVPLSRTMAGEVEALRTWANGRARRATAARVPSVKARAL